MVVQISLLITNLIVFCILKFENKFQNKKKIVTHRKKYDSNIIFFLVFGMAEKDSLRS